MNGFRDQIQLKFVENMPMVTVLSPRGFDDLDATLRRLEQRDDVLGAAPYIRSELVITHERLPGGRSTGGRCCGASIPSGSPR